MEIKELMEFVFVCLSQEQYKFLYKCLWDYTNMNKPGGVFSAGLDSYRSS